MNVHKTNARLRSAEKNRKFSTCKFADRVFLCVTKKLDDIVAKGHWPEEAAPYRGIHNRTDAKSRNKTPQTVLASFLIHNSKSDVLECVSVGMGTKFVDNKQGNLTTAYKLKYG